MNTTKNIPSNCKCLIYGDNNIVEFIPPVKNSIWYIFIGTSDCPVYNCHVKVGAETDSNGTMIRLLENNQEVIIGNDCMFSDKIEIYASDTHTIFDEHFNIVNIGKSIQIGNHVWIGTCVTILKNTNIPDNSIIGCHSVVCGNKFTQKGSVICGNPGKVVKTIYNWSRMRHNQFIYKYKEKAE